MTSNLFGGGLRQTLLRVGFVVAALVVAGCQTTPVARVELLEQRYEFRSAHMGTLFNMTIFATNQAVAEAGAEAAFRRIVSTWKTP